VSAIYVTSYSAFSIPAVIAGVAATHYGLHDTAIVYACAVVVLATVATVGYGRGGGRPRQDSNLRPAA
jgi:hypothetical protein